MKLLLCLVIFREFPIFHRGTKAVDKADTIPPKQLIWIESRAELIVIALSSLGAEKQLPKREARLTFI